MGLKEKRAIQAFQKEQFGSLKKEINQAAGFDVVLEIAWDTLYEDKFAHLYQDSFPKIYFLPLIEALKNICVDDFGKELLKNGLRKVVIINQDNKHNPANAITFETGVLIIDHSPILNADKVEDRTDRITILLENNLDEVQIQPKQEKPIPQSEEVVEEKPKEIDINEVYNQYIALSYEKQSVFADMVEDLPWQFDMAKGVVIFGDIEFPVQMLATYSEKESSWLWAWANKQSGIPEHLLASVYELKEAGSRKGLEVFASPKLEIDEDSGHFYGALSSVLTSSSCYCQLDFKGLKVYVLIKSDVLDQRAITQTPFIISNFTKMIANVDCSHKHALYCYLEQKGFAVEFTGNNIVGKKEDNQILGIFDLKGRLMKLSNTTV
ncbi:DUF6882 domain-containing protein [Aquimarina muelleri]|uniref:Uncharacterized protein n=1 Tax=Aquimarina muelleri TaxID=279356 RepID=A0A918N375_9FLAO|nr:DUF6882 domain-containing protein [Aquimarina muelleri]MCX2762404.1 hypothetical protein [Aquimarina muelleri]GGX24796.1 hypothetical protein GCM10007384_27300 [Aquimarina muelleri]